MAKDVTFRGCAGFGHGRPPKSVKNKRNMDGLEQIQGSIDDVYDIDVDYDIPEVSDYLTEVQRDGSELEAEKIFRDTYIWLTKMNCEKLVTQQLVEQYAMSVARWIQCERAVSKYGLIAQHPTTRASIASPLVSMSREYKKQVNADFYQIYTIVRENNYIVEDEDDEMEALLD